MSGVANLSGKGKYAEFEKENARLTAENKDMQFAVTKMEAQVAKIPMMVQRQVHQTIEEKNKVVDQENISIIKRNIKTLYVGIYNTNYNTNQNIILFS